MDEYVNNYNHCLLAFADINERTLLKQAIDSIGIKVELAAVGDCNQLMYAISEYEWLPDMLFLDANLPCKQGENVLSNLRATKTFKTIPIIVIGDSANAGEINYCYENGANIYITKGESCEELLEIFREILSLRLTEYPINGNKEKFVFCTVAA